MTIPKFQFRKNIQTLSQWLKNYYFILNFFYFSNLGFHFKLILHYSQYSSPDEYSLTMNRNFSNKVHFFRFLLNVLINSCYGFRIKLQKGLMNYHENFMTTLFSRFPLINIYYSVGLLLQVFQYIFVIQLIFNI